MFRQNQKFDINNNTNINNDECFLNQGDINNQTMSKYRLTSFFPENDPSRNQYLDSFNQPCLFQTGNFAGFPNHIDDSSAIRQGKYGGILTHDGTKRPNPCSNRVNPPFKGPQTRALDPDTMSRLYSGELTHDKSYPLREKVIDRFEPLIPEIRDEIQNPRNLIPTYWVNGGMSTKTVVRNIDYLKSCGLKR